MEIRVGPPPPTPDPRWAKQREGRTRDLGSAAGHSQERQTEPWTPPWAPRPQHPLFFSCLPSPTREMKLLGWATEAAETRLLRGGSGVPCLGSGGVLPLLLWHP